MFKTSNNKRLGIPLVDLYLRLSLLCQVGDDVICLCKICGDARFMSQDPSIHSNNQCRPMYNLDSNPYLLLEVCSSYVEHKNTGFLGINNLSSVWKKNVCVFLNISATSQYNLL